MNEKEPIVYDWDTSHPECKDGEMLIGISGGTNMKCKSRIGNDWFNVATFKSKRKGNVAYDKNGKTILDYYPIFVNKEEYDDYTRKIREDNTYIPKMEPMIAYRLDKKPDVYLWKDVSPKYLMMTRIEILWVIMACVVAWRNPLPEYSVAILFIYIIGAVVMYFIAKKKRKPA